MPENKIFCKPEMNLKLWKQNNIELLKIISLIVSVHIRILFGIFFASLLQFNGKKFFKKRREQENSWN